MAGNWVRDITGTGLSSTAFAGAEIPGVTVTLDTGVYRVDESVGPPGYVKTFSAGCAGIIALGESRTCTVTSDGIAP